MLLLLYIYVQITFGDIYSRPDLTGVTCIAKDTTPAKKSGDFNIVRRIIYGKNSGGIDKHERKAM